MKLKNSNASKEKKKNRKLNHTVMWVVSYAALI